VTIATIVYFSIQGANLFLHAVLITLFIALTAPVTTIFLMRAALFRERQKGGDVPQAHPGDELGLDGEGRPRKPAGASAPTLD
jgi:multicomponent K+:H+ antiporter subunit G